MPVQSVVEGHVFVKHFGLHLSLASANVTYAHTEISLIYHRSYTTLTLQLTSSLNKTLVRLLLTS